MTEAWRDKLRARAFTALTKKAAFGNDIDLSDFVAEGAASGEISEEVQKRSLEVGVDVSQQKGGTYFQLDHSVLLSQLASKVQGLELISIDLALQKYD